MSCNNVNLMNVETATYVVSYFEALHDYKQFNTTRRSIKVPIYIKRSDETTSLNIDENSVILTSITDTKPVGRSYVLTNTEYFNRLRGLRIVSTNNAQGIIYWEDPYTPIFRTKKLGIMDSGHNAVIHVFKNDRVAEAFLRFSDSFVKKYNSFSDVKDASYLFKQETGWAFNTDYLLSLFQSPIIEYFPVKYQAPEELENILHPKYSMEFYMKAITAMQSSEQNQDIDILSYNSSSVIEAN